MHVAAFALLGTLTSAGAVVIKLKSRTYTGPKFEGFNVQRKYWKVSKLTQIYIERLLTVM